MRSLLIIEAEPVPERLASLAAGFELPQVDTFPFHRAPQPLDKDVISPPALPSMEMATPASLSVSARVKSWPANCEPWSVLKISGTRSDSWHLPRRRHKNPHPRCWTTARTRLPGCASPDIAAHAPQQGTNHSNGSDGHEQPERECHGILGGFPPLNDFALPRDIADNQGDGRQMTRTEQDADDSPGKATNRSNDQAICHPAVDGKK
mgnify:CR=1 FL=1